MSSQQQPSDTFTPDQLNRLWTHGLHEERLFYDRLNYFTAMQVGLLAVFAILYNKDPAIGIFLPLTCVALAFTLLWHVVQIRHWRYCVHVNQQLKNVIPEYQRTLAGYSDRYWKDIKDGLSISRPLAFTIPMMFAIMWLAFFALMFYGRN